MDGQKSYFETLVESYQNLIFTLCYRMTNDYFSAEDLTQETFLSAYQNLSKFDRTQEKAWLCRIASRKCLDYLKKAERRSIPSGDIFFEDLPGPIASPEEKTLEQEVFEQLYQHCQSLPDTYRKAATDYFCHEKEISEIAREQKKSKKTVQTQIYRAKEILRKLYKR